METVTHREMRNNSSEILRRVENGESVQISNRGRVVAVLAPASRSILDDLIAEGSARPARLPLSSLRQIARGSSSVPTAEIVEDLRGEW